MQEALICKWGNSLALRLPRHVADQVRLVEGSTVYLEVEADGALKVTPTRKKFKLAELLEGHPRRDSDRTAEKSPEVDWGPPKGDEVW
jgi:antitoxin MazE